MMNAVRQKASAFLTGGVFFILIKNERHDNNEYFCAEAKQTIFWCGRHRLTAVYQSESDGPAVRLGLVKSEVA